jgi:S1-C subfamily serine protease
MTRQFGPESPAEPGDWGQPPALGASEPPVFPPPAHRRRRTAALVLLLLVTGAVVGAGVTLAIRSFPSMPSVSSLLMRSPAARPTATSGATPSLAPLPSTPPQSSPGARSGAALDPATIAAHVDPAIVDITVTIAGQGQGEATGMILTSSGEVLTNNHVVQGATSISVQVSGTGPQYRATVIGVDPTDDVALVQVTGVSGLTPIPLGNSSSVAVGDQIVALGNALGRGGTPAVTPGVVTGLDQTITVSDPSSTNGETLTGMIQVRAAIQPGDSGGPMVDGSGQVVGMTTAASARARRTGRIGFGIPIDNAMTIARQIQSGGGPNILPGQRAILGIQVDSRATAAGGAVVVGVQPGSPAAGAGMTSGDVITRVDGTTVDSADALTNALQSHKPGDMVTVQWVTQSGQQHSARVALASGPPA